MNNNNDLNHTTSPDTELSPTVDDFFGDQDDNLLNEEDRRRRELDAFRRPHYTTGVRQGVSDAHEANLQGGFDEGFIQGAKAVAEPAFLYGAASTLQGFYAKHGCNTRSESATQKLDDSEVPTSDLQMLQASIAKLRADIRQLPVDGEISVERHREAVSRVSLVEVPDDLREPK